MTFGQTYYKVIRVQTASDDPTRSWETVFPEEYNTYEEAKIEADRKNFYNMFKDTKYSVRSYGF